MADYCRSLVQGWCRSIRESVSDPLSRPTPLMVAGAAGGLGAWLLSRWWGARHRQLPPSPRGWPVLGNLLDITEEELHLNLLELQRRDNLPDIFTLRTGPSTKLIILNSHSAIKDAFVTQGDLFANRPPNVAMEAMKLKDEIFSKPYTDPTWSKGKMFIMTALRHSGFGSNKGSEDKILEQVQLLEQYLEVKVETGEPIDVGNLMSRVTSNVILGLLFSKTYGLDSPELLEQIQAIRNWYVSFKETFLLEFFPPWAQRLFFRGMLHRAFIATEECRKFIRREIEEHQAKLDPENPRDFIDIYLSRKDGGVDTEVLVDSIFVLLPDAMDTVGCMISWIILYTVYHPEVMRRIQDEGDKVTGASRPVTWSDRSCLPYTEAVIMEVIRVACPLVATLYHTPTSPDCYYRGYYIPAGVPVMGNLYAAMMDEKHFKDPSKFNPERFLDSDGTLLKTDHWIPFSLGRRKCPGEQTAKIEMFLFVANLFQRYDISFSSDETKPSLEPVGDVAIRYPQSFKVVLKIRH